MAQSNLEMSLRINRHNVNATIYSMCTRVHIDFMRFIIIIIITNIFVKRHRQSHRGASS